MPRWPLGPGFPLELCRQCAPLSLASRRALSGRNFPHHEGEGWELSWSRGCKREEPWPRRPACRENLCLPAGPQGPPSPGSLHLSPHRPAFVRGGSEPDCTFVSLAEPRDAYTGSAPTRLVLLNWSLPAAFPNKMLPDSTLRKIRQRNFCFYLQNSCESWDRAL